MKVKKHVTKIRNDNNSDKHNSNMQTDANSWNVIQVTVTSVMCDMHVSKQTDE